MRERGASLPEILVALAIVLALASIAVANLMTVHERVTLLGAGRAFKGEFLRARSVAMMRNVQTAMRFEEEDDGVFYRLYVDGNRNGVLSRDIAQGIDPAISERFRLDAGVAGVRVGILPDTPAPPPERGLLDTADPIRFGRSNMLSFSPLGTATPGTFYLASTNLQAAVRVSGGSARIRLLVFEGNRWYER